MFMDASCMHLEAIALFEYFLFLKLGGLKHNTYSSFSLVACCCRVYLQRLAIEKTICNGNTIIATIL